jgi:hypothetical protein
LAFDPHQQAKIDAFLYQQFALPRNRRTQQRIGADAALRRKIAAILKAYIGSAAFLLYRCGAVQRQGVGPQPINGRIKCMPEW